MSRRAAQCTKLEVTRLSLLSVRSLNYSQCTCKVCQAQFDGGSWNRDVTAGKGGGEGKLDLLHSGGDRKRFVASVGPWMKTYPANPVTEEKQEPKILN